MRKVKRPKIGEYVLVSQWRDHSMYDPWYVGHISSVKETEHGLKYEIRESNRIWRHVFRISPEQEVES